MPAMLAMDNATSSHFNFLLVNDELLYPPWPRRPIAVRTTRVWSPMAHCRTPLFQAQLYDTLRLLHIRPDLLDLEPRRPYHLMPLPLWPLGCCQAGHHSDINLGCDYTTSLIGQDEFIEEDLGIAWHHCGRKLRENEMAFVVGPVVEDISEIISTCAWPPG